MNTITLPPARAAEVLLSRPAAARVAAIVMVLLVAVGDYFTGIEVPFTILYLLPIAFATWVGIRRTAMVLSMVAVVGIACSLLHEGLSSLEIAWNLMGSAVLLVVVMWLVDKVRTEVLRERASRLMAIEQLRHAERLHVIGTLAAGVGHELGTPLNVIAGCAEFLAEDSEEETVQRLSRMILDQVAKVSTIIRRLLDFGRRSDRARSRIDLAEVASASVEMFHTMARKRGSGLHFMSTPTPRVDGNAVELEQVFSNLILNALQAASTTVRVRSGAATRNGAEVAFVEIEDDGCGIPDENLPRIFDPFFTTKGVGEGTGLGLSVSYGIVRDHHGWIEVTSEPHHGTRFVVILPVLA